MHVFLSPYRAAWYKKLLMYLFDVHNALEHSDGKSFGSKTNKKEFLNTE
jgi:hypothetical protein